MRPRDIFLSRNLELNLDESVAGYVYGAQYRFLMTIYPLLEAEERGVARRGGTFSEATVQKVFDRLAPFADLFSSTDPFLQVSEDDITVEIEGRLMAPSHLPGKLLPQGQTPDDNQSKFWNFDSPPAHFELKEAGLALVCYYIIGTGTHTKVTTNGQ